MEEDRKEQFDAMLATAKLVVKAAGNTLTQRTLNSEAR